MDTRFTMFGCWNNKFCNPHNPEENGMSSVFYSLYQNENKFDPNFYVIAGDNYYPTTIKTKAEQGKKAKKRKVLNSTNLASGFECLKGLDRQVFLLMGNHDLQEEKDFGEDHECDIIKQQLELSKDSNIEVTTSVLVRDDTLFLFLDTNLYEDDEDYQYARCELEYRDKVEQLSHLSKSEITQHIIDEIQHNTMAQLTNIVKDGYVIKYMFIIAHHPILGAKQKLNTETNTMKTKPQRINNQGAIFIANCFAFFPDAKPYYLCADIHQYQKSSVSISLPDLTLQPITQYIVGTGGAELDEYLPNKPVTNGILTYTFIEGTPTHGYLNVYRETLGGDYIFDFVPTYPDPTWDIMPVGLGVQRYKKSRRKKTKKRKKHSKGLKRRRTFSRRPKSRRSHSKRHLKREKR